MFAGDGLLFVKEVDDDDEDKVDDRGKTEDAPAVGERERDRLKVSIRNGCSKLV